MTGAQRFELQKAIVEYSTKAEIIRQYTRILGGVRSMEVAGLLVDQLTDAEVEQQLRSYAIQEVGR